MKPDPESQIRYLFANQPGYDVLPDSEPGSITVRDRDTGRMFLIEVSDTTLHS